VTKVQRPIIHGRDHEHGGADPIRIVWESVGGAGGGGGIMFDVAPQEGGFLEVTVTDGSLTLESKPPDGTDINLYAPETNVNLQGDGINIVSQGGGGIIIEVDDFGDLVLQINPSANLSIVGLPTVSPGGTGRVWNDGGFLRIT
jgi:hypothetical protein